MTEFDKWWGSYCAKMGYINPAKMREAALAAWHAAAAKDIPVTVAAALFGAKTHIEELREAWRCGVIEERDSGGGTRSNRNAEVDTALYEAIMLLCPAHKHERLAEVTAPLP